MRLNSSRLGLTLIEVVVALALAASLLTGLMVSYDRIGKQNVRAAKRIAAIEAVDLLLASWSDDSGVSVPDSAGQLEGIPGCRWEVDLELRRELEPVGCVLARLQVFDETSPSRQPLVDVPFITQDTQ